MEFLNAMSLGAANAAASATDNAAAVSDSSVVGGCAGAGAAGGWTMIVIYGVIILFFYLVLIRPQNKRRQQEDQMRKSVEVGDEITTIGGICGRIVSIKEDETLVIETGSDRNKMKIKTWAISSNDTARQRQEANPQEEKKGILNKLFNK